MKNWMKKVPPYEGDEPYLYCAFAGADAARVWKQLRPLLERGCRVWYCHGAAGGSGELLRRQERAGGAALTLLYLTDAACADKDTKTNILVNQKRGRPILCLDPDGVDRRLKMGLREDTPHILLCGYHRSEEREAAILHGEGMSQALFGEKLLLPDEGIAGALSALLCAAAVLLLAAGFVGVRFFHWFAPPVEDEISFRDPAILAAVRAEARGGAITEALTGEITVLRLEALPESWEELSALPRLETVELPQEAAMEAESLPEGYTVVLTGGERS